MSHRQRPPHGLEVEPGRPLLSLEVFIFDKSTDCGEFGRLWNKRFRLSEILLINVEIPHTRRVLQRIRYTVQLAPDCLHCSAVQFLLVFCLWTAWTKAVFPCGRLLSRTTCCCLWQESVPAPAKSRQLVLAIFWKFCCSFNIFFVIPFQENRRTSGNSERIFVEKQNGKRTHMLIHKENGTLSVARKSKLNVR